MTANISLRKADALSQNDSAKEKYFRMANHHPWKRMRKKTDTFCPPIHLATLYCALGDTATAKKWADEALPIYTTLDVAAAGPAVKYYIAIGDWQNAVRFLADLVEDNQSDYDVLYDLAKVTYLAGDKAASLRR